MEFLRELLEVSENANSSDVEQEQAIADINRKYNNNREAARREIERWKRERLSRVDPKTRALLMQKDRVNKQIDNQLAKHRDTNGKQ